MTASSWREDFQRSFEQVTQFVDAEVAEARATAESLNQAVRRMRQTSGEPDLLSILVETSAPFSKRAAGIVMDGTHARTASIRGFISPDIHFDLTKAAAVLSAIETRDPVVASATETELSPEIYNAAVRDLEATERCYLFPIVAAGSVRAILLAVGSVQPAPMEVLSETAAMRMEALTAQAPPPAAAAGAAATPGSWTDLPPEDRAVHLKAQRFARVKVAEMRVSRPAAVREGQERGAIYAPLRPEIDAARATYRKEFMQTPSMVDYLYIELVRSLANDDDRLLGPDFPGRLI